MPAGARARIHAEAAGLLAGDGADPEQVALHLLHTQPTGESAGRAMPEERPRPARPIAEPLTARHGFSARALAEPPTDRAIGADVRLELGLARAARWHPDAPRVLADAVTSAGSPAQRAVIALRGARASGSGGLLRRRLGAVSAGSRRWRRMSPRVHRERLEAELTFDAACKPHPRRDAATAQEAVAESLTRRRPRRDEPRLPGHADRAAG